MKADRLITTYSMWNLFRNCRRACFWRYVQHLVPLQRKEAVLRFGSLIHECLEIWHDTGSLRLVFEHIDESCIARDSDPDVKRDWHYARAMMAGYAEQYPAEEFSVVALEKEFTGEITNPATGAKSKSFVLSGKVDGIVQKEDGSYWLLEHKTASSIGGDYVSRLWTDFQVILYAFYVREAIGIPVTGVIYNILQKPKLVQSMGETEEEFQQRHAALAAKNKSGKSSARRKEPESDEAFQGRLAAWFAEKDAFLRVELLFDSDDYEILRSELWELTQQYLAARRRDAWYQNTAYCFNYHRPCSYYAICSSKNNPLVIENEYEIKAPHQELDEVNKPF